MASFFFQKKSSPFSFWLEFCTLNHTGKPRYSPRFIRYFLIVNLIFLKFRMKSFNHRLIGIGVIATSLVGFSFIQPSGKQSVLNIIGLEKNTPKRKGPERIIVGLPIGPEKEFVLSPNSPKSTLRGRVQTTPNESISLSSSVDNQKVSLTWNTPTGHNSHRFIVQRSRDLETFFDVGELKISKNSDIKTHAYVDDSPTWGAVNYYRIIEIDLEKVMHVYTPIAAEVAAPNGEMYGVTLHTSDEGEMVRIKVDNVKEANVLLNTVTGMGVPCDAVQKSKNEVILLPNYFLSPGEYIVKVRNDDGEKRFRILVKKSDDDFMN
jgi:hypothetical protein